jgi:4,5-DOPA dioxygenase extradiol
MTALEPREAGAFWQALGPAIDSSFGRPRAILALSAHTMLRSPTDAPVLLAAAQHHAVHDFSGFDEQLYGLRYSAPGAPALAAQVQALLAGAGIPAALSPQGGLDHGLWVPLRFIYPQADLPVLPLAFSPWASPQALLQLGRALAPLAAEGVLVLASGSLTHNLRWVFAPPAPAIDAPERAEVAAFRHWIHEHAAAGDEAALAAYRSRAPHAAAMHPSDEHWLPWYAAWGAGVAPGGAGMQAVRLHQSLSFGCLAMDAYAFGPSAGHLSWGL